MVEGDGVGVQPDMCLRDRYGVVWSPQPADSKGVVRYDMPGDMKGRARTRKDLAATRGPLEEVAVDLGVQPDLAAWLLEQVAKDERAVSELQQPGPSPELTTELRPIHSLILDADEPGEAARFRLVECDTKRHIIAEHSSPHTVVETADLDGNPEPFCTDCGGPCTHAGESECQVCTLSPCPTLRLLALPYRDRDGYVEAWAPDGK